MLLEEEEEEYVERCKRQRTREGEEIGTVTPYLV
jgi:hypothetical protein